MLITLIVIVVVSGALLLGAAWGLWGSLSERWEGLLIAVAGGALIESLLLELIEPSVRDSSLVLSLGAVVVGATVFTLLDYWVDEKRGASGGMGLLIAISLDGVPENLALGVALIGASPLEVAALAGSIFLSNLPEAAGGAREMVNSSRSKGRIFAIWGATALVLSAAALGGNLLLQGVSADVLAGTRCFAAGAVVASLATEVFPKAYREGRHSAGSRPRSG